MTEAMARFGLTKLVSAVIAALLALASWGVIKFEGIEQRKADKAAVESRLDRIEDKLDMIIQQHIEQNTRR